MPIQRGRAALRRRRVSERSWSINLPAHLGINDEPRGQLKGVIRRALIVRATEHRDVRGVVAAAERPRLDVMQLEKRRRLAALSVLIREGATHTVAPDDGALHGVWHAALPRGGGLGSARP